MKKILIILIIGFLYSCSSDFTNSKTFETKVIHDTIRVIEKVVDTIYIEKIINRNPIKLYIQERIPERYFQSDILAEIDFKNNYQIEDRLNSVYLEEDFNGDGNMDIILSIKQVETKIRGFAIIDGGTNETHILFAGKGIKNGEICSDNSINSWEIDREKIHSPGAEEHTGTGEEGELILENPSIYFNTNCGCGLIYWDGKQYSFFSKCW